MAASSVPVRKDVPNTKEDLDSAGVRFVYFSAQNMKRSKPVAEKIGKCQFIHVRCVLFKR